MLKGTREAVLHRVQPVSVHGQLSFDVYFAFVDEPDGTVRVARVGGEAMSPDLQPGERVRLDILLGAVTAVHRV